MKRSRFWSLASIFLLLVALFSVPARADISVLLDSGAKTVTGASGVPLKVTGAKQFIVQVDCTASSGTTPQIDLWIQSATDGATFNDDLFDMKLADASGSATEGAVVVQKRDILDAVTSCAAPLTFTAVYNHAAEYIRARWFISGTTPSFTVNVRITAK